MTAEERMTEAYFRTLSDTNARKGLGRWPVTIEMVEERKAKMENAKAEERELRKAEMEEKQKAEGVKTPKNRCNRRRSSTPPLPSDTVRGRIRNTRLEMGISQSELERRIGASGGTVSQWESGIYTPNDESMLKLAKIFDVTVKWLKTGAER